MGSSKSSQLSTAGLCKGQDLIPNHSSQNFHKGLVPGAFVRQRHHLLWLTIFVQFQTKLNIITIENRTTKVDNSESQDIHAVQVRITNLIEYLKGMSIFGIENVDHVVNLARLDEVRPEKFQCVHLMKKQ